MEEFLAIFDDGHHTLVGDAELSKGRLARSQLTFARVEFIKLLFRLEVIKLRPETSRDARLAKPRFQFSTGAVANFDRVFDERQNALPHFFIDARGNFVLRHVASAQNLLILSL